MKTRAGPLAAFGLAATLLSGCSGQESADSTTTLAQTNTTTAATTTTASATTTASTATTTAATTTTTPGVINAPTFAVPFQMTSTEVNLVKNQAIADGWIDYRGGTGEYVLFTTGGRETVDAWLEFLTTDPRLIATEPTQTEIGGQPATTIDVRLTGAPFNLFTYAPAPGENAGWEIVEGGADRIHLLEVDGVTIAIFIEAPDDKFEEFASGVDAALATLEWNPAG